MIRPAALAATLILAPFPAAAEWLFAPPAGVGDTGTAYVDTEEGHRLFVGCGASGTADLSILPDPRGVAQQVRDATVRFRIDDGEAIELPMVCFETGCFQAGMLDGGEAPMEAVSAIIDAIRRGGFAVVTLEGEPLLRFTLKGSGAALRELQSVSACEGL